MSSLSGLKAGFRAVGGVVGGFLGTAIIAVVAVGASGLLKNIFEAGVMPVFVTLLFLLTFFFASVISSSVACLITSKTDSERFFYLGPALLKMLVLNIVLFILLLPAYLIGGTFDVAFIPVMGVVHFIFSSLFAYLIFDLEARVEKKPLLSLFSCLVGSVLGSVLIMLFFNFAGQGSTIIFIVPLVPIIMWTMISGFSAIFEIVYGVIYRSFGVDIFATSGYDRATYEQKVELHETLAEQQLEDSKYMK